MIGPLNHKTETNTRTTFSKKPREFSQCFSFSLIIIAAALKLIYNGEPIELESIPAIIIIIIIILHHPTN
jgi:hypothetical protein